MKKYLIIILFCNITLFASGQIDGVDICNNSRPDTITTFQFSNNSILVSKVPGVKATSNCSFKKVGLELCWAPVITPGIDDFVDRCLRGFPGPPKILDTLSCNIFKENYKALVFESKNKIYFFLFQDKAGHQDFFIGSKIKRNKIQETLNFITSTLQQ